MGGNVSQKSIAYTKKKMIVLRYPSKSVPNFTLIPSLFWKSNFVHVFRLLFQQMLKSVVHLCALCRFSLSKRENKKKTKSLSNGCFCQLGTVTVSFIGPLFFSLFFFFFFAHGIQKQGSIADEFKQWRLQNLCCRKFEFNYCGSERFNKAVSRIFLL